jgi:hypothetical protein
MSVVLPWKARLTAFQECCFAALLSTFLFGILDVVGLKMLWWTWHNTDPLYADRILGVPAVSAVWIMASTGSLSYILRAILATKWAQNTNIVFLSIIGALAGPFATLVVMNIPFLIFYHPVVTYMGYSATMALNGLRLFAVFVVLYGMSRIDYQLSIRRPYFLLSAAYIVLLLAIALFGNPAAVRRESFSQPYGACDVAEPCMWGAFQRSAFVCNASIDPARDHYNMACLSELPTAGAVWYTVCGVAADTTWWAGVALYFAGACIVVLLAQLAPRARGTSGKGASGKGALGKKAFGKSAGKAGKQAKHE